MPDSSETQPPSVQHPPAHAQPIRPAERVVAIDVVRGLAILGILLVNVGMFKWPHEGMLVDLPGDWSLADRIARWLTRTLAEGKFYLMFSALFGLGMSIQMERLTARGASFASLYTRRLLILLAIGVAHITLFWYGDILALYAVLGFTLLLLRKRSSRTVLIVALVAYVLPILAVGAFTGLFALAELDPDAAIKAEDEMARERDEMIAAGTESIETYRQGTYGEVLRQRLSDYVSSGIGLTFVVPTIIAMFLFGMYVGRRRWISRYELHARLWRRLAFIGLPVGLALNVAFTIIVERTADRITPTLGNYIGYLAYMLGGPLMTFGYAAAIFLLMRRARWPERLAPLAAVGRMALTNYLLQTLICTTIFYSYGFGMFGKVGAAVGLLLTATIYAGNIVLSVWWLRRFQYGPMEWLWRSLTYAQMQPMRRTSRTSAA